MAVNDLFAKPGTFFKSDEEPRAITKAKRRAEDRRNRREHHHLQGRNVAPERVEDPTNIITACAEAHSLIESGHLIVEGIDTRQPIRFHWREDVDAKSRIFRIHSRRWSANE